MSSSVRILNAMYNKILLNIDKCLGNAPEYAICKILQILQRVIEVIHFSSAYKIAWHPRIT